MIYDDVPNNGCGYMAGIVGQSFGAAGGPVEHCYNIGEIAGEVTQADKIIIGNETPSPSPSAESAADSEDAEEDTEQEDTEEDSEGDEDTGTSDVKQYSWIKDQKKGLCVGDVPIIESYYLAPADEEYSGGGAEDSRYTSEALTADDFKNIDKMQGLDFNGTWYLAKDMAAPQLIANSIQTIENISFETKVPTKTAYAFDEEIDLTGLTVKLTFEDGTSQLVGLTSAAADYNARQVGTQTVTAYYGPVSVQFEVTVAPEDPEEDSAQEVMEWNSDYVGKNGDWEYETYALGDKKLAEPVLIDQGEGKDYQTHFSIVEMGSYPQTKVDADEEAYAALTDSQTTWDALDDATVDGQKYRRVKDSSKESYSYYRYEPVRWRVLRIGRDTDEDGNDYEKVVLIADQVLDVRSYGKMYEPLSMVDFTAEDGRQYSEMRSWLNGWDANWNTSTIDFSGTGFMQQAFEGEEQKLLSPLGWNPLGRLYDPVDSTRQESIYIDLPNWEDVTGRYPCFQRKTYLLDPNRQAKGSDYVAGLKEGYGLDAGNEEGYSEWLCGSFESEGYIDYCQPIVNADGTVDRCGYSWADKLGIRPMIAVNLEAEGLADTMKYIGTMDDTGAIDPEAKVLARPEETDDPEVTEPSEDIDDPEVSSQPEDTESTEVPGDIDLPEGTLVPGEDKESSASSEPGLPTGPRESSEPGAVDSGEDGRPGEAGSPEASTRPSQPGGTTDPQASSQPGRTQAPATSTQPAGPGGDANPQASSQVGGNTATDNGNVGGNSTQTSTTAPNTNAQAGSTAAPGATASPTTTKAPETSGSKTKTSNKPTTVNLKNKKTYATTQKVTVKDADGIKTIRLNAKTIKPKGAKSYSFKLSKYKKYLKKAGKWNQPKKRGR